MSVDHATAPATTVRSPGSQGEHPLQSVYGSGERAERFYRDQVCNRLLPTMVDFVRDLIGLHINGSARIVEDDDLRAAYPDLPTADVPGRRAALWVLVEVEEAYIHCRRHPADGTGAPRPRVGHRRRPQ